MYKKIAKFVERRRLLTTQKLRTLNFKRKLIKEQKEQMRIKKLIRLADA